MQDLELSTKQGEKLIHMQDHILTHGTDSADGDLSAARCDTRFPRSPWEPRNQLSFFLLQIGPFGYLIAMKLIMSHDRLPTTCSSLSRWNAGLALFLETSNTGRF